MPNNLTEADGYQLVADMLYDVETEWLENEEFQNVDDFRLLKGEVLRRYLSAVREAASPELEQGFFAALTDFIGSCVNGGVPDPESYEKDRPERA